MNRKSKAVAVNLNEITEFARTGIVSKTIVDNSKVKYVLFCLERGQRISEHKAPFNAGIYVVKGNGEFSLGKEKFDAASGCFFHMPAGLTHAIVAKQNLVFLLVMVRA